MKVGCFSLHVSELTFFPSTVFFSISGFVKSFECQMYKKFSCKLKVMHSLENSHSCTVYIRISANSFRRNFSFWIFKTMKISFLLCNENLNSVLIRVQNLFKGGNYSREETVHRNTVHKCRSVLCFKIRYKIGTERKRKCKINKMQFNSYIK